MSRRRKRYGRRLTKEKGRKSPRLLTPFSIVEGTLMFLMIPGFTIDLLLMANQHYAQLMDDDNPMKPPFTIDKKSFMVGWIIGYLRRMAQEDDE